MKKKNPKMFCVHSKGWSVDLVMYLQGEAGFG